MKLQFFLHKGDTEIGGFGISSPGSLLYVEDFITVKQSNTSVTVAFDDTAIADFYEDQVVAGRKPDQFSRIWIHTHPGESAHPSSVDEETFARVFGKCDWSIMFIIGRTSQTYCRLAFPAGPGSAKLIDTKVHWELWPETVEKVLTQLPAIMTSWAAEFVANIHPESSRFGDWGFGGEQFSGMQAQQNGQLTPLQEELMAARKEAEEYEKMYGIPVDPLDLLAAAEYEDSYDEFGTYTGTSTAPGLQLKESANDSHSNVT